MKLRYLSGVVTLVYDISKCTGCRRCIEVCPHGVFVMENDKARVIDGDACIECGACMNNCAFGALKVDAGVGCAAAVLVSKKKKPESCCNENACC
jgi:NAD-dependent dihydropyrimidine dehydrogenase PreA subunit